jgi:hypothetical protein
LFGVVDSVAVDLFVAFGVDSHADVFHPPDDVSIMSRRQFKAFHIELKVP